MEKEIWKDVKDYEGYYQISNLGNVRCLDRTVIGKDGRKQFKKGCNMKIQHNKKVNIYEVGLYKNNKRKMCKIHRLVAGAFIENDNPENKITVNHKDGNRSNNCVNNLEWASYSENEKHAYSVLNRPVVREGKTKKPTIIINKDDGLGLRRFCKSVAHASRETGMSKTQIKRIANGESVNEDYDFIIN